jgi:hypothetical protein
MTPELAGIPVGREFIARRSGNGAAAGSVRAVELSDGVERGVRTLQFRTGGGLSFELLVDRTLDIGSSEFRGDSIGWLSPTGFRHPGLHEYESEDGLSWARSFSGTLLTGGLDHTLFGGRFDAGHYRYAPRTEIQQSLHGRIAHIPAVLQGYGTTWTSDDHAVLWAEAHTRQAAVFGENLVLRRRVEADLGGTTIRLIDTVTNEGFEPTPHMYLYHINFGWPLLDEGTRFVAPIVETTWCTDAVWQQQAAYDICLGPQDGFEEQVYEHSVVPDAGGHMRAMLINDRLELAAEVIWNAAEFPHLLQWMNLRSGAYGFGIEPSTHRVAGQDAARQDGTMIWLGHGESRRYHTAITVHSGADEIAAAERHILDTQRPPAGPLPRMTG